MKKIKWTAQEIKTLREYLKITQTAFAQRLGITQAYVSALEADQKTPSSTLMLLLDCLERDVQKKKSK